MALNGEKGPSLADEAILEAVRRRWTTYIPLPERPKDQPFLMPIEDVFSISGPWHGGDGSHRARHDQGRRGG